MGILQAWTAYDALVRRGYRAEWGVAGPEWFRLDWRTPAGKIVAGTTAKDKKTALLASLAVVSAHVDTNPGTGNFGPAF